jgi:L-lactate utilization protein LutC
VTDRTSFLERVRTNLEGSEKTPVEMSMEFVVEIGDPVLRFGQELERAGGVLHLARQAAAEDVMRKILAPLQRPLVMLTREQPIPSSVASVAAELGRLEWWPGAREVAADADVGVTGALWAVAETGTVLISSASPGGRAPSLLPPIHVAFVARTRLVATLADLFGCIVEMDDRPSNLVLVTGPSKSGDIENVLVRRVHGPGETHVVMLEDV